MQQTNTLCICECLKPATDWSKPLNWSVCLLLNYFIIKLIGSGLMSGLPVLTSSCSLVQSREKKKSVKLLEVRKQVICWNVRASPGQDMGEKASSANCCLLTLPEHMRLFHSYPSCIYRLLRFCTHSAPEEEPTNINGLIQKQLTGPIFKQLIWVLLI